MVTTARSHGDDRAAARRSLGSGGSGPPGGAAGPGGSRPGRGRLFRWHQCHWKRH